MSEQSVNIDLGRLENRVEQLARIQDQTNEKLDGMGREITQVQKNLSELASRFEQLMREQKKIAALQQATTELVRVRQEIDSKFGDYKTVRGTMLGALQATDLALVKKTTISRVSEELMLSTPKYWLAPCLVAVSAWIGNDRDLAERAIAEAVKRDEERTALTMALICRRNNRADACYEWLALYFSKQDAANFSEGTFTYIDAYVNGVFGPDKKHICDDYITRWLNEIRGSSSQFEQKQEESWKGYCDRFHNDIGGQFPTLKKCVSEYDRINDYVGRITSVDAIAENFDGMVNAYVDQDVLKKSIDENLINLISRYDEDEEPLRKEEAYYQAVKYYEGDTALAKNAIEKADNMRRAKTLNLVEQMLKAVQGTDDVSPSKKKTAVSFLGDYIKKGFNSYITENKEAFPQEISINVEGWTGTSSDGDNYVQLSADFDNFIEKRRERDIENAMTKTPKKWLIASIISAVMAVAMLFAALPVGIGLLVVAGVCLISKFNAQKDIRNKVARINEDYDELSKLGKQNISDCLNEWVQVKNITEKFDSEPVRDIIA